MSALWALLAFGMTLAGGAFAFRYQRYLNAIMAFSAGLLIGVVFLDLIPEIVETRARHAMPTRTLMLTLIAASWHLPAREADHHPQREDARHAGHHHHTSDWPARSASRSTASSTAWPSASAFRRGTKSGSWCCWPCSRTISRTA
jgi:hypothetical protein